MPLDRPRGARTVQLLHQRQQAFKPREAVEPSLDLGRYEHADNERAADDGRRDPSHGPAGGAGPVGLELVACGAGAAQHADVARGAHGSAGAHGEGHAGAALAGLRVLAPDERTLLSHARSY